MNPACRKLRTLAALQEATHATTRDPRGSRANAAAASRAAFPAPCVGPLLARCSTPPGDAPSKDYHGGPGSVVETEHVEVVLEACRVLHPRMVEEVGSWDERPAAGVSPATSHEQKIEGADVRRRPGDGGDEPGIVSASVAVRTELGRELQSPSAAAGLRREFSPARPPGLGGGHCALGLVDAVAHEPCGGSPVQGYKG